MATGPEHYQLAEASLDVAGRAEPDSAQERYSVSAAQVHATLALAAATALSRFGEFPAQDCEAWLEAASGSPYRPAHE